MSLASQYAHTTRSECIFLDGLGGREFSTLERTVLLKGYRAAIPLRARWDGMDCAAIAAHCDKLLNAEFRRQKAVAT